MVLVYSHEDLPSTFGSVANVTLSRLTRHAKSVHFACDTYKYQSVTDITIEDHGLV